MFPTPAQVLIHPWLVCCALLLQDTGQVKVVSYRQNTQHQTQLTTPHPPPLRAIKSCP